MEDSKDILNGNGEDKKTEDTVTAETEKPEQPQEEAAVNGDEPEEDGIAEAPAGTEEPADEEKPAENDEAENEEKPAEDEADADNEEPAESGDEASEEKPEGCEEAAEKKPAENRQELTSNQKRIMSVAAVITVFVTALVLVIVFSFAGRTESSGRVIKLISSIGTVTADSGEKLSEIEKAYNKLSADEKNSVSNYTVYIKACRKYENLILKDMAAKAADENALVIVSRANATRLTGESANFPELLSEAEKLLADGKVSDEMKEKLNAAVTKINGYNAAAAECAACYVKAFNRVYKLDSRTVTSVGCIINILDGAQENWYAITYTQDGTEGTVYAHASVTSAKATNTIVSNPDLYFADAPVSDNYDAIKNPNTTIDLSSLNLTAEE